MIFFYFLKKIAKFTFSKYIESEFERRVNIINIVFDDDFSRVKYKIYLRGDSVLSTV
jgi:hypothetical protein